MKRSTKPKVDLEELIPHLISAWRRVTKLSGPPEKLQTREFRKAVEKISQLTESSSIDANPNYLLYHWPIHYQELFSILGELPKSPGRVLDAFGGFGAGAMAALKLGAKETVLMDSNETAMQQAGQIIGKYGFPLTVRKWEHPQHPPPVEGTFDTILLNHNLESLFPSTDRLWKHNRISWIQSLVPYLSKNGFIVLTTDSENQINRRFLELRNELIDAGFPIQAPCIWQGACPALKNNSPCYAQRELEKPYLISEIQRALSVRRNSLKMSYLILRHPEASAPIPSREPAYRVVSPPIDSHKGPLYFLCGTEGGRSLSSHLKEHPKEARAFEYLKRGDAITIEDFLKTNRGMEIIQGTALSILAPAGKPLPEKEEWA